MTKGIGQGFPNPSRIFVIPGTSFFRHPESIGGFATSYAVAAYFTSKRYRSARLSRTSAYSREIRSIGTPSRYILLKRAI